jgi:hypothetical protein
MQMSHVSYGLFVQIAFVGNRSTLCYERLSAAERSVGTRPGGEVGVLAVRTQRLAARVPWLQGEPVAIDAGTTWLLTTSK